MQYLGATMQHGEIITAKASGMDEEVKTSWANKSCLLNVDITLSDS